MHDLRADLERYRGELDVALAGTSLAALARAADLLLDALRRGATVFALGNGGSAATASHFACDLAKGTRVPGMPHFRVVPLTDNVPLLTAWGNDASYDRVFAEQLLPLVRPGDLVVAISASGNSPNVLAAAEVARRAGATVLALTGPTGGRLAALADHLVRVPADRIEQVEDVHLVVAHQLCVALRERLRAEVEARVAPDLLPGLAAEPAAVDLDP